MERNYQITARGATPLIMHSCQAADPLNEYAQAKKKITSKRSNKTEADYALLQELDFKSSLYWDDDIGLHIPAENLQKMILESARALDKMKAKKQIVGHSIEDFMIPLDVKNAKDFDALVADPSLRYVTIVTVQKAKNPSCRAKFNEWAFKLLISVDDEIVNPTEVKAWWEYAGKRVGVGARRPYGPTPGSYGKFIVESFEEVK